VGIHSLIETDVNKTLLAKKLFGDKMTGKKSVWDQMHFLR